MANWNDFNTPHACCAGFEADPRAPHCLWATQDKMEVGVFHMLDNAIEPLLSRWDARYVRRDGKAHEPMKSLVIACCISSAS